MRSIGVSAPRVMRRGSAECSLTGLSINEPMKEQTMNAPQPSEPKTRPDDGGADLPNTPREPEPPTTKDLPDLPEPQEVGEDG